ncbi:HAD hydrolase family protein [Bacteriovoracaceae bacterium]|nr:HAD hydrolase family protein [Bacteriovoracaceae bacterium]
MILDRKYFEEKAKEFKTKIDKIKVCAFDVDGILTDGKVYWSGEEVGWNRSSHTRDGYGLKLLQEAGLKVGIITGGDSLSVVKRYKENLGLDFLYKGNEDKVDAIRDLVKQGYDPAEIFYMGDELFDIPLLKIAGFSATVEAASPEVLESVDYIAKMPSGEGCVREVIDIIRYAKEISPKLREF